MLQPWGLQNGVDRRAIADLDPEQRQLVEAFQPYNDGAPTTRPTGKPPLGWLRDLSNKDKHKALTLVIGRAGFVGGVAQKITAQVITSTGLVAATPVTFTG